MTGREGARATVVRLVRQQAASYAERDMASVADRKLAQRVERAGDDDEVFNEFWSAMGTPWTYVAQNSDVALRRDVERAWGVVRDRTAAHEGGGDRCD